MIVELVRARGHRNVLARHRTTLEITKDNEVTPRGDCIIGVSANKAAADLSPQFKEALRSDSAVLIAILEAGGEKDVVLAMGRRGLLLEHEGKIVLRKSEYVEPATIGVRANKSAGDISRSLVEELRKGSELLVKLIVLRLDEVDPEYTGPGGVLQH